MRIALDANRYADFLRGVPEVVRTLRTAAEILLPFVVLAELRAGFRAGTRARANERVLAQFLSRRRVTVLWPDEATTHIYADLFAELRAAGTPIPTNDLWIAALAVQYDVALYSRDRHFDAVARLARILIVRPGTHKRVKRERAVLGTALLMSSARQHTAPAADIVAGPPPAVCR